MGALSDELEEKAGSMTSRKSFRAELQAIPRTREGGVNQVVTRTNIYTNIQESSDNRGGESNMRLIKQSSLSSPSRPPAANKNLS